ncbi:hypothetical protein [Streptomyces sp. NPDC059398]|uniref:hypothetical protein n=1 Tax=Streptomyces sp. NPDC059398 TaxID=3346820 RepID=UPI00367683DF
MKKDEPVPAACGRRMCWSIPRAFSSARARSSEPAGKIRSPTLSKVTPVCGGRKSSMTWPSYPYEAGVRGSLQRDSVIGSPGFARTMSVRKSSRLPGEWSYGRAGARRA